MDITRNGPIDEHTLVELLRRAKESGDPEAFDGLYLLYADRIFRFLLGRVKKREVAEDLTSQVFVRLIERIHQYDVADDDNVAIFSAWLYQIARNIKNDAYRSAKRTNMLPIETVEEKSTGKRLITEVEKRLDLQRILDRLQTLSELQQDVIVLRFIEELTVAETARVMNKSEGAVKTLQYRALANLRQYFHTEV